MQLSITNYRAIRSAELDIDPIALIAGNNGAGKSSIAQAVGAVMTATPAPVAGFKKNEASALVTEGEKRGRVELNGASITLPGGSSSGKGPRGSAVAAGLDHPLDMKPSDAAKYLSDVLKATPARADLDAALPDLPEETRDKIWQTIENQGWDAVHRQAKETGSRLKGKWEEITGQNYGTRVADGWMPEEFGGSLPTTDDLKAAEAEAVKRRDELVSQQAVSADVMERNQKTAAELDDWKSELKTAQETADKLRAEREPLAENLGVTEAKADSLPKPGEVPVTAACPSCGTHLVVVSKTELATADGGPDEAENEKRRQDIEAADAAVREAAETLRQHDDKLTRARDQVAWAERNIAASEQARQALEAAPTDGATEEQIDAAQHDVDLAAHRLALLDAYERATRTQASILQSVEIVRALAPDGVRKTVLSARLGAVNEAMADMCRRAGFPAVEITEGLEFTLGGRGYRLLSESEQFRVRVVVQLLIADMDGSQMVVIDRADILDRSGRQGVMGMVLRAGIPAVICMTMNDPADVSAKLRERVGCYWVDGGEVRRLENEESAAE